ncbi:unnamed protein product [Dovyalis caffra]|uniref:Gamma-interferon-inducible lysosomal thiol reductase n=1 Tax=Dovyalis caffra TaxID=77055 RepID=A0AAV1S0C9_9ROSI|nr:unnamed protein product [Dovyalis caffra]
MASSSLLSILVLTSLLFLFATPSRSSENGVAQEPAPPVRSRKISENGVARKPAPPVILENDVAQEPAPPVRYRKISENGVAREPAPPVISENDVAQEPAPPVRYRKISENGVAREPAPPVRSRKISHNSEKVTLSLYYESLCPYCGSFIVGPLAQVLETDLMTILNLRLVPWGNAILDSNNTIECQHGEDECYLNIIHACSINIWADLKKHFNFIKCIEKQYAVPDRTGAEESWEACADKLKLPTEPIKKCYDSGHGKELVLQNGEETDHLSPPHEYVPWVVVDDKPLLDDYKKFIDYVCKAYKGKHLPKTCSSDPNNSINKENSPKSVCYASEARSTDSSKMPQMKMEPLA